LNPEKRQEIFLRLQAANPQPTTELEYHSAFELLVAVILSAQATDVSVNAATRQLFPVANTPQSILELGVKNCAAMCSASVFTKQRQSTLFKPADYYWKITVA
jgi:endonuclease III